MTPNILLFPEWGKLLFSLADVGIVYLIYSVRILIDKNKQFSTEGYVCDNFNSRSDGSSEYNDYDINCSDESKSGDSGLNLFSISKRGSSSCDDLHSAFSINNVDSGISNNNSRNKIKNKDKDNANASHSYDDENTIHFTSSQNNTHHNTDMHKNNNNSSNNNIPNSIQPHLIAAWLWALNPLAINICSRGSADSLTNCMVLALLYCLLKRGTEIIFITFTYFMSIMIFISFISFISIVILIFFISSVVCY